MPDHRLDADPFSSLNGLPLAAYTDSAGYEQLQYAARPNARTFRRLCPVAAKFAEDLSALCSRSVWGIQGLRGDHGWSKYTAGTSFTIKGGRVANRKAMTANDVLASLARKDRFAVGTEDRNASSVRLDIDCPGILHGEDLDALRALESACRSAGAALGLPCHFRTTGGGGVAADYPLPDRLEIDDALTVTDAVRRVLEPLLPTGAKLDVDGCRSLMRLPLMRNAKTSRLGLYIRDAKVLPVEEQLQTAVEAMTPTGGDTASLLAAASEVLEGSLAAQGPRALARTPEEQLPSHKRARGANHAHWDAVRASRPEPGGFYEWLESKDLAYAFVWPGTPEALEAGRSELYRIASEVACASEAERRLRYAKIDWFVDTFVMFDTGATGRREKPMGAVCAEDEMSANEMFHELLMAGYRADACHNAWLVARAYCHAVRIHGRADARDTHRMCCRLYGEDTLAYKTVLRLLPPHNITVTIRDSRFAAGGYVMPESMTKDAQPSALSYEEPETLEEYEDLGEPVVWGVEDAITTLGDHDSDRTSDVRGLAATCPPSQGARPGHEPQGPAQGGGRDSEVQREQEPPGAKGAECKGEDSRRHSLRQGQGDSRPGRRAQRNRSHVGAARVA